MASRYQSAEIFVVCGGFKAPGKVDPRLLDPKHLFNDTSAEPLPALRAACFAFCFCFFAILALSVAACCECWL